MTNLQTKSLFALNSDRRHPARGHACSSRTALSVTKYSSQVFAAKVGTMVAVSGRYNSSTNT